MQRDLDDFESPYFDWNNDRMFDESSRKLIDQIANDPRFNGWSECIGIVEELAPDLGEDEQEGLLQAACEVFELTVRPGLEARASQLIVEALADSDLEALPLWSGESTADADELKVTCTDPDPRVREEFKHQLADAYQRMHEEARTRAEGEAREIVRELPPGTRDRLVLASRNAERESLLDLWLKGASERRRGWIAYYAQRIARQDHEESVLDRYSAAVKILAGRGWRKKAIADAMEIGVGRIDRLLERSSGQDIVDDDPLCDLVPHLRGRGNAWRDATPTLARKPKPFGRLSIAEKIVLAEESSDSELLARLAKQGSRRLSEALLARHCRTGDVGDDILQTILFNSRGWWMRGEMIDAHHVRPLPIGTALALAAEDPRVLLDCDDATALKAKDLERWDFEVALAVRESNVDTLEKILMAGSESEPHRYLVDLLIERPLTDEMLDSSRLLTALLRAAEQTDDLELSIALRLIACQSPEILSQHIEAVRTGGSAAMMPEAVVAVALGPYHRSGSNDRSGVKTSARAFWEAVDLTAEQSIARAAVAERGSDVVSLETTQNIYIAAADAIRSFRKSETTEYTYVHMHLTSAVDLDVGDVSIRMPSGLPALGYHRETRKHPSDAEGPDVEAIVWPMPFQPAIYSLDIDLGKSAGLIAVSGGQVAVVEATEIHPRGDTAGVDRRIPDLDASLSQLTHDFAVILPELCEQRSNVPVIYEAMCSSREVPAADGVAAFVGELRHRYGLDHDGSDEALRGCEPDARGTIVTVSDGLASIVAPLLLETARDHDLAVYDPQLLRLYDPRDRIDLDVQVGGDTLIPFVTERLISELFGTLDPEEPFIIFARADEVYMQVYVDAGEPVVVEYRDGGEDRHFHAETEDSQLAQRVIWAWATNSSDWRDHLEWERMDFD